MLRPPAFGTEAVLEYSNSDYRVLRQGTFVRCGVTGNPIQIEDLRYWSAERQEAYSSPEAVLARLAEEAAAR
ncbi:MAG: DUF2093 domain-containing protein [Rhizobiales bacterium]|nr:DUF2093 domain-containing protein [Hyphomicrobiales bacterium]